MSLETPESIRRLQRKLYHKAKAEPAYRFYLLYDKICREDILRHAYDLAKHQSGRAREWTGSAFEAIEAAGLEEWLGGIRKDVGAKTYRPAAGAAGDDPEARRRRTAARYSDDPGPGGADRRQAGAGTDLRGGFDPATYGYRPRRSGADAIKEVHALLCRGYTDVVDADLSKYFDTIPHQTLMRCVARRIVDRHVLRLIKLWLKAPVEERSNDDGKRRLTGGKSNTCGTPQGGVDQPAARQSVHEPVPEALACERAGRGLPGRIVSYADDFVILSRKSAARGAGMDAAGDDQAWARSQRGEDRGSRTPGANPSTFLAIVRPAPLS